MGAPSRLKSDVTARADHGLVEHGQKEPPVSRKCFLIKKRTVERKKNVNVQDNVIHDRARLLGACRTSGSGVGRARRLEPNGAAVEAVLDGDLDRRADGGGQHIPLMVTVVALLTLLCGAGASIPRKD